MKLQFLAAFSAGLSTIAADSIFVQKERYLQEIAPGQLSRLTKYRQDTASTLTAEQSSVLDAAEHVIGNFDTEGVANVKAACSKAFGAQECATIFYDSAEKLQARSLVAVRGAPCSCTDRDPHCPDAHHCQYGDSGCGFHTDCGWSGFYVCNGNCKPNY